MGSIWHIGIAVPDLEEGKEELGEVFGLRWRPARVRKLTLADAAGPVRCTTSATGSTIPPPRRNGSARSDTPATLRPAPRRC
jgi:hypothetical protein